MVERKRHETEERKQKIKDIGDMFVSENFDKNYATIHTYQEYNEKLNALVEFTVLKRKDLMFPVLDKEQKEFLNNDRDTRNAKNNEKIKNLIRDS